MIQLQKIAAVLHQPCTSPVLRGRSSCAATFPAIWSAAEAPIITAARTRNAMILWAFPA